MFERLLFFVSTINVKMDRYPTSGIWVILELELELESQRILISIMKWNVDLVRVITFLVRN